jgi:uncharacterized protein YndB with AHSA1/START domain
MDRIEKTILLKAPRSRVWRAITDTEQFGAWFGMRVDRPFAAGATVKATVVGTTVDAEVAKKQKQYEGTPFDMVIERVEPETLFSFRWHPGAPGTDYAKEPMTLVEFKLAEAPGGVMLTVTESGFDQIPLERRAQAFSGNEEGWALVVNLIEKYVAKQS